jgi:dynein heavy chain
VTLVNFVGKEVGVEAQRLGIVVQKEEPKLEEQKGELVFRVAKNKRKIQDLENEILRQLQEAKGSLLDDEELVVTLQVRLRNPYFSCCRCQLPRAHLYAFPVRC